MEPIERIAAKVEHEVQDSLGGLDEIVDAYLKLKEKLLAAEAKLENISMLINDHMLDYQGTLDKIGAVLDG